MLDCQAVARDQRVVAEAGWTARGWGVCAVQCTADKGCSAGDASAPVCYRPRLLPGALRCAVCCAMLCPQGSKTPKFTRGFVLFLAFAICKLGAQAVSSSMDAVQPKIMLMILQQVRGQAAAHTGCSTRALLLACCLWRP